MNRQEEPRINKREGPLTARQVLILEHLQDGLRHKQICTRMELGVSTVKQEIMALTAKMGVATSQEAVAKYSTAVAYRNAAAQVRSGKIRDPLGEVELHVNHVLDGIADLFRHWYTQRMPG